MCCEVAISRRFSSVALLSLDPGGLTWSAVTSVSSLVDEGEELLEQLGPADDDGVVVDRRPAPVGSFPPWTLTSGATGFALSGRNRY